MSENVTPSPTQSTHLWRSASCLQSKVQDQVVLVVGKGPSFSRIGELSISHKLIAALNHSVLELLRQKYPVHFFHFVDAEVWTECSPQLSSYFSSPDAWPDIVVPFYWNEKFNFCPLSLDDRLATDSLLLELAKAGKIFAYSRAYTPMVRGTPQVFLRGFSVTGMVDLLGYLKAREIELIGVDGGKEYAPCFQSRPLQNGQPSFDVQFRYLALSVRRYGVPVIHALSRKPVPAS